MSGGPPPVPGRGGRSDDDRERARRARRGISPSTPSARRSAGERTQPRQRQRPGREPRPQSPRTKITARGRLVLGLLALLALVAVWIAWSYFQPLHGDGGKKVRVTIPRAAGVGTIANVLSKEDVIGGEFFFKLRARLGGQAGDLKPGTYTLREDMSYSAALAALEKGPPDNLVTLLVPEGKSRREIAPSIKSLEGNYLAATKRNRLLNPARYGAENARDLEGFLFPASYELKPGQPVDALVEKQLKTFKERFAEVDLRAAKKANLTPYDVLIIASLVERETAVAAERELIASVIYNRLREGIPLGIDATTRFQYNDWENPLRQSQLQSPSPYNTRLNQGLPPGPIGSPGLPSIEAAANPGKSDYLYYVANPCKPGSHTFVETNAEFESAVAKYNAAREAAGGKAPQGC